MKNWLIILFFLVAKNSCCQTSFYISAIDSLVAINDQTSLNYCADSIYQSGANSLFLNAANVKFFFADSRGKKLIKADELTQNTSDTTHIIYYFHEKQVVKIIAHTEKKHFSVDQVFYFKNNKLLYPQSFDNSPFSYINLMDRAKLYLRINVKNYHRVLHSCNAN